MHGSKLGGAEISALKAKLGFEDKPFAVDTAVVDATRANAAARAKELRAEWDPRFEAWRAANPRQAELLDRVLAKEAPADLDAALPVFEPGSMATRAASGKVLSALADAVPELWGGSADLAGSNNTTSEADVLALVIQQARARQRQVERAHAQQAVDAIRPTSREVISTEVKRLVWQRDGGRCASCGDNANLEFDHIIPIAMGGANTVRNLQLLCMSCNRTKGASLG